ncbi:MAG: amidohydrolase family protein [Bryobacteraceae bacterium]
MRFTHTHAGILGAGLLILTVGCSGPAPNPDTATTILYEGARLVSGDSVVESSAFLVENGAFIRVGKKGEIEAPKGAATVDLTGKTVIPGLIDTHSHLGWALVQSGYIARDTYSKDNLIDHLKRLAYYGVVANRNLGIDPEETAYEVRANPVEGAALLRTAGRGMGMPMAGPGQDYWKPIAYGLATEEDARNAVQELVVKNADIIKIWVDDRDGKVKKLSPALYRAVIDEAHKNNKQVIAHIFTLADGKDLVKSGVDAFGHLVRDKAIDDELITLIKAKPEFYVIPNLPPNPDAPTDWALVSETVPAAEVQKLKDAAAKATPEATKKAATFYKLQAGNLAKFNTAGVRIALGTDSSEFVGWPIHTELADMVAAGMTPVQALAAATKTAAEVLRIDELGAIAPGKSATFDVLNANPLDDIKNTSKIADVYIRGKKVDRAALRAAWTGVK